MCSLIILSHNSKSYKDRNHEKNYCTSWNCSLKFLRKHVSDLICYYSLCIFFFFIVSTTITLGFTQLSRYYLVSDVKRQSKTYLRSFQWILVLALIRSYFRGVRLPISLARTQGYKVKPSVDFLTQEIRMNDVLMKSSPPWAGSLSLSSFSDSYILPSA